MIKCDFCSCPLEATRAHCLEAPKQAVVAFDGSEFVGGIEYDEQWAACDVCFARICKRDFESIIEDLLATMPMESRSPDFDSFVREGLYKLYSNISVCQ
jgi:hypothetical protein